MLVKSVVSFSEPEDCSLLSSFKLVVAFFLLRDIVQRLDDGLHLCMAAYLLFGFPRFRIVRVSTVGQF